MDPVTAFKIAQAAAQQLKEEKKRERLLTIVLVLTGAVLFLYSIAVYIVTHPLDALFGDPFIPSESNVSIKKYSEVEDTVWFYLKDIGFSDCGAAGVMGNIKAECNFNPADCYNGIYHGLCQWGMGRWEGNVVKQKGKTIVVNLKGFSELRGTDWTDLETQLYFFDLECRVAYPNVYKQMTIATDVQYACDYFCTKYEDCVGKSGDWAYSMVDGKPYQALATRRRYAEFYYNHYVNSSVIEKGK